MDCAKCKGRELWVLDCDNGVECPMGVNDYWHYHYYCELCGHEEVLKNPDDGTSAFAVLDASRRAVR